jgi:hypothetical protein
MHSARNLLKVTQMIHGDVEGEATIRDFQRFASSSLLNHDNINSILRRLSYVQLPEVNSQDGASPHRMLRGVRDGLSDMKVIDFLMGSGNTEFRCVGWSIGEEGIVNGFWFLLVVVDGVGGGYNSMDNRVILES